MPKKKADSQPSNHGQLLSSSAIIGASSVINIIIGFARMKVVAVLLGPAGVGLIGMLQNIMATASIASALGFGSVGTRQIAQANGSGDQNAIDAARRALFWGTLFLAAIGGGMLWAVQDWVALKLLGNPEMAANIGWLGLGVALTVAAGSQRALLNGMRRIRDIASISIISAVLSTVSGTIVIYWLGEEGIIWFVLVVPLVGFFINHLYVARLPSISGGPTPLRILAKQWRTLAKLGLAFMIAGLATIAGQLVVRTLVQTELGSQELGYFQAAWTLSITAIGFVHSAMYTDYYPRLTASIHDHQQANRLINEQTEVAILLAGPLLLAMLAVVPWLLQLLYSTEFMPAATVLRWQLVGDVLKVVSWPLGFIFIAAGKGRLFMLTETSSVVVFALVTWLALPVMGIEATGVGFFAMHLFHLLLVIWLSNRYTGFRWSVPIFKVVFSLFVFSVIIAIVGYWHDFLGVVVGMVAAFVFGLLSLIRLARMTKLDGPLGKLSAASRNFMKLFKQIIGA